MPGNQLYIHGYIMVFHAHCKSLVAIFYVCVGQCLLYEGVLVYLAIPLH